MKHILLAFMLLASFKSNGQNSTNNTAYLTMPKSSNSWRLISTGLSYSSTDSTKLPICKQRGHAWKVIENTPTVYSLPYVRDVKDTSYIVTPGSTTYYYCLRCNSDSTYTSETLKIIWTKH